MSLRVRFLGYFYSTRGDEVEEIITHWKKYRLKGVADRTKNYDQTVIDLLLAGF